MNSARCTTRNKAAGSWSTLWALASVIAALAAMGCAAAGPDHSARGEAQERDARRLYEGAPPTIPHPPLGAPCGACHDDQGGFEVAGLGIAPASPHGATPGMGSQANCRQCHVFQHDVDPFVGQHFTGFRRSAKPAERLFDGAPPVMPHRSFMHESCLTCHAGTGSRIDFRFDHAQRSNCRQCHAERSAPKEASYAS